MDIFGFNVSINALSVTVVLIAVLILLIVHKFKSKKTSVEDFFIAGFSAASIPTGATLLYCAYEPSKITLLESVTTQIALVGAGVIFLAYKSIVERM